MSDKNTYNQDFINKGWQDMSAILDKEMPVKKKKKRFFILFFFFGLLSVIAFGITLVPMQDNDELVDGVIAKEEISNQRININTNTEGNINFNKEKEVDNKVDELVINQSSTKKENDKTFLNTSGDNYMSSDSDKNKILKNNSPIINNKAIINNSIINYNDKSVVNYSNIQPLINNENSIKNILPAKNNQSIINKEYPVKDEGLIPNNQSPNNDELLMDDKLLRTDSKYLNPIALDEFLLENEKIESIEKVPEGFNPKKWKFGIETGLVFQNKNEFGGKLGFVTTRHFNRKWALHTGLEYNAYFVNYAASTESNSPFEASNQFDDNSGVFVGAENYQAIYLENSTKITSHFLKIPLLVAYRFNRSFEMNAGIVNSFNLYSKDRDAEAANSSDDLAIPQPSSIIEPKTIKPFYDPQASLGLTYYPTKKWGISLRYDYGFVKKEITATIPESDYQAASKSSVGLRGYGSHYRLLNLSARMYF